MPDTLPAKLNAKVALVTGGASGIGRAAALAFARQGANVVIADLDEDGGQRTVQMIAEHGGEAMFIAVDVARADQVEAMITATAAAYGRLDCAFNNAGRLSGHPTRLAEYPEDIWRQVLDVNLTGVLLCMKYELQQMLQQGGGAIVNNASISGLVGFGDAAGVASKHGVVGLTKAAALEYAKSGIRVNCVCPGVIRTPMMAPAMRDPERLERMQAAIPRGRVGEAEEVAESVVWLCSEAASFVTGHAIPIDGGYVAQ